MINEYEFYSNLFMNIEFFLYAYKGVICNNFILNRAFFLLILVVLFVGLLNSTNQWKGAKKDEPPEGCGWDVRWTILVKNKRNYWLININRFSKCTNEHECEYYSIMFISIQIFFIRIGALQKYTYSRIFILLLFIPFCSDTCLDLRFKKML